MTNNKALSNEGWRLIDLLVSGKASEEDIHSLEAMLASNPVAQKAFLDYCQLHIDLSIEICANNASQTFLSCLEATSASACGLTPAPLPIVPEAISNHPSESTESVVPGKLGFLSDSLMGWAPFVLVFAIGVLCTVLWNRYSASEAPIAESNLLSERDAQEELSKHGVVAQLVSNTDLVFDVSSGDYSYHLERGASLRAEQLINVPRGIAQIVFSDGATLHLEGPTVIQIDSTGRPVLQYGKVLAKASWGVGEFSIDSKLGTIRLDGDDTAGITLFGSNLQVHGFEGEVRVTFHGVQEPEQTVWHGDLLRCIVGPNGDLVVSYKSYVPELFDSRTYLTQDSLGVTNSYSSLIRNAKPIGYWRFEESTGGMIQNEMSDKYPLKLGGAARLIAQDRGNHVLEFGYGINSGHLITNENIAELKDSDYTFETWIKPGHSQWGTIAGLIQRRSKIQMTEGHGFLLELVGETAYQSVKANPGAVRFLHRSPPGDRGGTSCLSKTEYLVRKWQHVVATKKGSKMSLYLNGKLVGSEQDKGSHSADLTLLIGQVYSFDSVRPLVGQMDEFALYNRALSRKEVKAHYELLKNQNQ